MKRWPWIALGIVMLVGCATPPAAMPPARDWALPPGVKAASVNGYEMAYVERGSGTPVVFVHGSGVDYRYFAAQMEPFASAGYRAISVSLRRYYPEPYRGQGDFSLDQQVADLVAFIRQLDAGPVHVVGHSRGGTVSLYLAKAAPELVRSLTVAEGGSGMAAFSKVDPAVQQARVAAFGRIKAQLSAGEVDAALETFLNAASGPGAWKTAPEATRQSLRDNAWTLVAAVDDDPRWSPFGCDDAKRFSMPVLLLGGERSPPFFGTILDALQACLPAAAQRGRIANSSHTMPSSNPDGFNTAVLSFLLATQR